MPAPSATNSGGPPMRVATTVRPHAIASRIACPNGSTRDGVQTTSAAARRRGTSACGTRPVTCTLGRDSSRGRNGPSPTDGRLPRAKRAEGREGVGEAHDVLALREAADGRERRTVLARFGRLEPEAVEVDAGVDDVRLPARPGKLRLELAAQVLGDGDDGARTPHDAAGE